LNIRKQKSTFLFLILSLTLIPGLSYATYEQLNFIHYSVTDGLPSSETYFIHQDHRGFIWVCTDRGVSRYNGYEFENFSTEDGLSYNTVFSVYEDKDHVLWFCCYNGSLFCYDYRTDQFYPFWANELLKPHVVPSRWYYCVGFEDNKQYLYVSPISTKDSSPIVLRIDSKDSSVKKSRIPREGVYEYDNLYVAVSELNEKTAHLNLVLKKSAGSKIGKSSKDHLFEEIHTNERLYLTKNGISIKSPTDTLNFSIEAATSFTKDRDGNYWVSTLNRGIIKIPSLSFRFYPIDKFLDSGDQGESVAGYNGSILIGSREGKIICFNPLSGEKIDLGTFPLEVETLQKFDEYVFGAHGIKISGKQKLTVELIPSLGHYVQLENYGNNEAIARGQGHYLAVVHINYMEEPYLLKYLPTKIISLHVLNNKLFYCSTYDSLYQFYDKTIVTNLTEDYRLENTTVRKITSTEDSTLLFGTSNKGVLCVKNQQLKFINEESGLVSSAVNDILVGSDGSIWCATNKGLGRIHTESDIFSTNGDIKITNFSTKNGLGADFIIRLTELEGDIWAISDKGLIECSGLNHSASIQPPVVSILGIQQNGSNYNSGITFNHDQNSLSIKYLGISFKKPIHQSFFRYKLEKDNSSEEWRNTNKRSISFAELSPGKYRFSITARSENGNWAKPETTTFTIRPTWYSYWWAQASLLGLIAVSLYFTIKKLSNYRHTRNKERRVAQEMKSKLDHTELALLRGQMNPHFAFNTLSSVQKSLLHEDKATANEIVGNLAVLLRSSLEYSRAESICLEDEVEFINNYMTIEQQRFKDRFNYDLMIEKQLDTEIEIPPMMIQPICENAIKHAFEKATVTISIRFDIYNKEYVKVEIADDGKGIKPLDKPIANRSKNSFGLDILSRRISILSEKYPSTKMEISPLNILTGTGTVIKLILPIL